jgi:hypothetical protein
VTANDGSNDASVLLGRGDGTFGSVGSVAVGIAPRSVAIGDLNGDGNADVVTASSDNDANDVSVLLGRGDGSFAAARNYPIADPGTYTAISVAIADVIGDRHADIIGVSGDHIAVLSGHGDGTFSAPQTFPAGPSAFFVAVADANEDDAPDLVTADYHSDSVSVLLGNTGRNGFAAAGMFRAGDGPTSVTAGDLNQDGHADLITTNGLSNDVSVLIGRGDGTFAEAHRYAAGGFPIMVAVAELNGDGHLDLVTAANQSDDVSILLGLGDGRFAAAQAFAAGRSPSAVALADLNEDGRPDVLTANSPNRVTVLLAQR